LNKLIYVIMKLLLCWRSLHLKKGLSIITLALFVLSVLVIGSIIMPVTKAQGIISLTPSDGPPGTTVDISGSGLPPCDGLWIYIGSTPIASATVGGQDPLTGTFGVSFTVPNLAPGAYTVTVNDLDTPADTSSIIFIVTSSTSPSPTPTPSPTHSPTPTASPTPSPSPTPAPSTSPTPTPTPTPVATPTPTPVPTIPELSMLAVVLLLSVGTVVAVAVVRRRRALFSCSWNDYCRAARISVH